MRRTNNKQPSKPLYASLIHARFPRLQCPFDDDPCFPHSPNAITNFQILLLNAQWRISSSFTQFRLFKIKSREIWMTRGYQEWTKPLRYYSTLELHTNGIELPSSFNVSYEDFFEWKGTFQRGVSTIFPLEKEKFARRNERNNIGQITIEILKSFKSSIPTRKIN